MIFFLRINTGGKPITPNDVTDSLTNGHTTTENGGVAETVTKAEVSITSIDEIYEFRIIKTES